jgi:hypothetical protein
MLTLNLSKLHKTIQQGFISVELFHHLIILIIALFTPLPIDDRKYRQSQIKPNCPPYSANPNAFA